jgi:DNA-binding Lrp family transcriptional regulator
MLDDKNKKLLNILLDNSRLSFREVAKKANTSVVTVIKRVKELEKQRLITGYTTQIDYEKAGYDMQAIIQLRISRGKLLEVENKIAKHPNVFAVYDTAGNFDSVIIAKFKSRRALDTFLKKIQTYDFIERSETKFILNTIKEESIKLG